MKHLTYIEPLEDRIAPATIINPYTVTYQDTDGDSAVVHISKPLFTSTAAAGKILIFSTNDSSNERFAGNSVGEFLGAIDLLGVKAAQDMDISVKVIPQVGIGNAQVSVGEILAASFSGGNQVSQNIDLGNVTIQGNLGLINVGDNFSTPALKTLTVGSMNEAANSTVLGPILNFNVKGNFNANMQVVGDRYGSITKLTIGGSLAGDSAGDAATGLIEFTGHIGSATIGSIAGTSADNTGELIGSTFFPTSIGSVHVLGSITGGTGVDSGRVFAQASVVKLTVDGSVTGGAGQDSGEIAGPLHTVNISGSLTGGSGISSGTILSETFNTAGAAVALNIGTVKIGGDVTGGTAGVAAVPASGSTAAVAAMHGNSGIISAAAARSITIGGSLIGGTAGTGTNTSGTLDQTADTSGVILVDSVTSLTIGKNIIGGTGPNSGLITGQSLLTSMKYGTVAVNGDVTGGAGANSGAILANGVFEGAISSLHIGGNLTGSSGTESGVVLARTSLDTLFIGGNVTGGTADDSGEINTSGTLKTAVIHGNLTGNTSINSTTAVVGSAYIEAGRIGTLEITGNVTSGANSGTGGIANAGAIRSAADILSLAIGGAITGTAANPVVISATHGVNTSKNPKTDLAIQSVTIGGAVTYLDLLAGYSTNVSATVGSTTNPVGAPLGTPTDGSAQIGTVTFMSTLSASNVVAGAQPDTNGQFGTSGNTAITTSFVTGVHSQIASIIVAGAATGDSTPATDSFGFVAENLESVTVNGSGNLATGLVAGTPKAVNSTNLFLLEVKPAT